MLLCIICRHKQYYFTLYADTSNTTLHYMQTQAILLYIISRHKQYYFTFTTQFCHRFLIFLVAGKNTLLFLMDFLQMLNYVHSYLTKSFIKLGGVLSCVMAFSITFFHNCNRILADKVDNNLVTWDNKIFRAPFTVESFLHHQFFVSWLPTFYSP